MAALMNEEGGVASRLQAAAATEDLWCLALGLFQVWMFVVVFLIMLPAMFGLSLGVTGVYIQVLVRVLEVTEQLSVCRSSVSVYFMCLFGDETCSRRRRVRGRLKYLSLQWATLRIQRGRREQPSVPVPLPNGTPLQTGCEAAIFDLTCFYYLIEYRFNNIDITVCEETINEPGLSEKIY